MKGKGDPPPAKKARIEGEYHKPTTPSTSSEEAEAAADTDREALMERSGDAPYSFLIAVY